MGAGHAVAGAECRFKVGINGPGNVRFEVMLRAGMRLHQIKAAVEHAQRLAVFHQQLQLFGRNQGGVVHVALLE